jgi:hypothetical protein
VSRADAEAAQIAFARELAGGRTTARAIRAAELADSSLRAALSTLVER